jgi:hypothetical protein
MSKGKITFKSVLIGHLETQLNDKQAIPVDWDCAYCYGKHSGNLLKNVKEVQAGTSPDEIELMNEEGNAFKVIGISKLKKVNAEKIAAFREQGVIYIEVSSVMEEGKTPADQLAHPKFLGTCLNPKCKVCSGFLQSKNMIIIDSTCWKCDGQMKVAVLEKSHHYPGPDAFSPAEIEFARSKGALIQSNYSKTVGNAYLSNTCPHCNAMTGNHYLFTEHYTSAIYGYYNFERFPQGYYCEHCEED